MRQCVSYILERLLNGIDWFHVGYFCQFQYSVDSLWKGWRALKVLDDATSQVFKGDLKSGVQLGLFDLLFLGLGKLVVKGGGLVRKREQEV